MADREFSYAEVVSVVRCQAYIRSKIARKQYKWIKSVVSFRAMKAQEIYNTEKSYVAGLAELVELYLKPLRDDASNAAKLISKEDLRTIFSEVEVIMKYTDVMLNTFAQRVKNWGPNQKLGDCFLKIIDFLKVYSQYVNNYDKAMETVSRLEQANPKFAAFLREREARTGTIVPIENYLIMPVQRIPRYSLLLDELVKNTWKSHPDYDNLQRSLTRMNEVAVIVNEMKRERDNMMKVLQTYRSLNTLKPEMMKMLLDQKNRKFVREGMVIEMMIKNAPTKFWLFAFNDLLIWSKQVKAQKSYEFKATSELSGAKLELKTNGEGVKFVHVRTNMGLRAFRAESGDAETVQWFDDLKKLLPDADSVDELSSSETIRVTRTTSSASGTAARSESSSAVAPSQSAAAGSAASRLQHRGFGAARSTMKLADLKHMEETERQRFQRIADESARIAKWQELDDFEELSLYRVSKEECDNFYRVFSRQTYDAFSDLSGALAKLNIPWNVPEIVLVGRVGEGKTSVLEAFLGFPLSLMEIRRPIFVHLQNKKGVSVPRITLRKDLTVKPKITSDVLITSNDHLAHELELRAYDHFSDVPVHLDFEHEDIFNATIIDTPGLDSFYWGANQFLAKKNQTDSDLAQQIQNVVLKLISNPERILVFVEESKDKNLMSIASRIASAVDPNYVRSVFVYSKFYHKLRDITSRDEVNKYLGSAPPKANTFFVSVPSAAVRARCLADPTAAKYRKKVAKAYLRDLDVLDFLQYNTEYAGSIGIQRFRSHIFNILRHKFRESVPTKLDTIQVLRTQAENQLSVVRRKKALMNVSKLRQLANEYAMLFVKYIGQLVEGSTEVEASVYGQNLADERELLDLKHRDWVDAYNVPLDVASKISKWGIPLADAKLYGSAQVIRLFSVFGAIVDRFNIKFVKAEDVAAAMGTARPLNSAPYYESVAFDVARAKIDKVLGPLIEQLCERIEQMLKRLGSVSQTLIVKLTREARTKLSSTAPGANSKAGDAPSTLSMDSLLYDMDVPLFAGHVRVQYEQNISDLAQECLFQCREVISQNMIYDFSKYANSCQIPDVSEMDQAEKEQAQRKVVMELASDMFADMSKAFLRVITVRCYETMIARGMSLLKRAIQNSVFGLSDKDLQELFDVTQFQADLAEEEQNLVKSVELFVEGRKQFFSASEIFSSEEQTALRRALTRVQFSRRNLAKPAPPLTASTAAPFSATLAVPASSSKSSKKDRVKKSPSDVALDTPDSSSSDRKKKREAEAAEKLRLEEKAAEEKKKAKEAEKKKADEEAKKKAEEAAKRKADEEAKRKAEEASRKAAEDAKKQAELEAKQKADADAKKKADAEAAKAEKAAAKAADDAKQSAQEEEQPKKKKRNAADEEATQLKAAEDARKAEEETKRKQADEEAKKKAEAQAKAMAEEETKKKQADEEAKKKAEAQAKAKVEEEEAKRNADEEAKRKAEAEAAASKDAEKTKANEIVDKRAAAAAAVAAATNPALPDAPTPLKPSASKESVVTQTKAMLEQKEAELREQERRAQMVRQKSGSISSGAKIVAPAAPAAKVSEIQAKLQGSSTSSTKTEVEVPTERKVGDIRAAFEAKKTGK